MALFHSPTIPTGNLIFHFDAINKRSYSGSGNTWLDISGNRGNVTMSNGMSYGTPAGQSSPGMFVNANNDQFNITIPGTISTTTGWCLSYWFYQSANSASSGFILNFGISTTSFYNCNADQGYRVVDDIFGTNPNSVFGTTTAATFFQRWVCMSFNCTGTTIDVYRNGEYQATSNTISGAGTGTDVSLSIGAFGDPLRRAIGYYNMISLWRRSLTAQEAKRYFVATRQRFGV